ncbi:enoyl-CoA hydratase-related protein [Nocardia sp. NPDC052278]|uniref:enoyl-CoA hydratase-related protein n=1 Tax=unclassified Nocardia TaxID=2637762 RepID=UPI0036A9599F
MGLRILLLCSTDNGLCRRARLVLQHSGNTVRTATVADSDDIGKVVARTDFDLIICPYLTARIPDWVTRRWWPKVVVIHPGPVGDRGPSSLDWAITDQEPMWGVIAVTATDVMDAGPLWATRTVALPQGQRKSDIYRSIISDAAVQCIVEVADKAADPTYRPTDQADAHRPIAHARTRPRMRQSDRAFDWRDDSELIRRRILAADGSPGVRSHIADRSVYLYDAHPGHRDVLASAGTVVGRRHHALEIACGDGKSIWIGHLRVDLGDRWSCKAPAVSVLDRAGVPARSFSPIAGQAPASATSEVFEDIAYRSIDEQVGELTFRTYNGAMSTDLCRRLARAIRAVSLRDSRVLVVRGETGKTFSNGLHLGAIECADDPADAAWQNIVALNEVCKELLLCPKLTLVAITGSCGAGGAVMTQAGDVVVAIGRAVLDVHYATMGLRGSELQSLTLPRRVGAATAHRLLTECEPVDTTQALDIGLVDHVGPDIEFDLWLNELAHEYALPELWEKTIRRKHAHLARDLGHRPLEVYECRELAEMAANLFDDSLGFAAKRRAFMQKAAPRPSTGQGALGMRKTS